ncbi:MAG: 3-keto-disaccharide hydrolase [Gemmatimonas sp.]
MSRLAHRLPKLTGLLFAASLFTGASANAQAKPGEWQALVSGSSADGWRGYKMTALPPGWTVADGVLSKMKVTEDIITKEEYGDFEFEMEWKLARGGNSGLFYRASEEFDRVYWSAVEYQLLDDANAPDGKNRLTSAAAAYGLYAPPEGVVKPFGEWNTTRVIAKGAHVEHWLNGKKVVEYELWSPDWEAKVAASKFKTWAKYGRAKTGHIAIQGDHNGELTLRNVRIRKL